MISMGARRDIRSRLFGSIGRVLGSIDTDVRSMARSIKGVELGGLGDIECPDGAVGVFTDGSNVVSERRGAGIVAFSAVSLVFRISGGRLRVLERCILSPATCFLVMVPRFNVRTRANNIMRGLELLTATYMLEKGGDVQPSFVVLDGSYVSTLLSARWGIEHIYRDLYELSVKSAGSAGMKHSDFVWMCGSISDHVRRFLEEEVFSTSEPGEISRRFLESHATAVDEMFEDLVGSFGVPDEAWSALINFLAMFLETNFMMECLRRLLVAARRRRKPLMWLNKEPESRMLARRLGRSLRMLTDAMILDIALRRGEYLRCLDLPKIDPSGKYVDGERCDRRATHALVPDLADEVYGIYGSYGVIYVKYADFVIQYTYPRAIFGPSREERHMLDSAVLSYVRMLWDASPLGYPHPMIQAHSTAVLREGLAEVMADSLLEGLTDERDGLIRRLIEKPGRRLAGV